MFALEPFAVTFRPCRCFRFFRELQLTLEQLAIDFILKVYKALVVL